MRQLFLILRREYLTRIRNKSFLLMTFLSPLAFVGLSVVIMYLTQLNNHAERSIEILDESGQLERAFEHQNDFSYHYHREGDLEQLKKRSQRSDSYGLLHIHKGLDSFAFFSSESPSPTFVENLQKTIEQGLFYLNLQKSAIRPEQITQAQAHISIGLQTFSGNESSQMTSWLQLIFGGTAGYLLMMFIIVYGNMIMRSVIEEKSSRIVEIILSSVPPRRLLLGKILGTSLVGISQFVVWIGIGGVLYSLLPIAPTEGIAELSGLKESVSLLPLGKLSVCFLLYFVGGYLVYSAFYAMIGAAVDSETDTQQFLFPVLLPLMLAIYVGFFTVIEAPHGSVSTVFSYIPLTSSVVMLMRIPFGVSWGEILVSLGMLYGFFLGCLWVAGRIYRIGVLSYGRKPTYRELFKWLKIRN